jgi:hypothetical protein
MFTEVNPKNSLRACKYIGQIYCNELVHWVELNKAMRRCQRQHGKQQQIILCVCVLLVAFSQAQTLPGWPA